MAGSSANWFRPTAGPMAGQAVYIPKNNRLNLSGQPQSRQSIMSVLNAGLPAGHPMVSAPRPAGVAQKKALPPAPPASIAPSTGAIKSNASGSIHQAPNGQFGLYNNQGNLVKSYKTQGGATRALDKLAGGTSGQKPTTARTTPQGSVLHPNAKSVVINGETMKVRHSAGRLAVVDLGSRFGVVDIQSGEVFSTSTNPDMARSKMNEMSLTHPESHVAKHLDAAWRATRTIKPVGLPKPGSSQNPVESLLALGPNIAAGARKIVGQGYKKASTDGGDRGDPFLAAIQQAHGFDAMPAKATKSELDAMYASGEVRNVMSRGAGGFEQALADAAFYGAGPKGRLYGAGVYTADRGKNNYVDQRNADRYARRYSGPSNQIAVMGLRKDARVTTAGRLKNMRAEYLRREHARLSPTDPDYNDKRAVLEAFALDMGYFGAAMGYDAITAGYGSQGFKQGIIVYNRSALVVQDTLE